MPGSSLKRAVSVSALASVSFTVMLSVGVATADVALYEPPLPSVEINFTALDKLKQQVDDSEVLAAKERLQVSPVEELQETPSVMVVPVAKPKVELADQDHEAAKTNQLLGSQEAVKHETEPKKESNVQAAVVKSDQDQSLVRLEQAKEEIKRALKSADDLLLNKSNNESVSSLPQSSPEEPLQQSEEQLPEVELYNDRAPVVIRKPASEKEIEESKAIIAKKEQEKTTLFSLFRGVTSFGNKANNADESGKVAAANSQESKQHDDSRPEQTSELIYIEREDADSERVNAEAKQVFVPEPAEEVPDASRFEMIELASEANEVPVVSYDDNRSVRQGELVDVLQPVEVVQEPSDTSKQQEGELVDAMEIDRGLPWKEEPDVAERTEEDREEQERWFVSLANYIKAPFKDDQPVSEETERNRELVAVVSDSQDVDSTVNQPAESESLVAISPVDNVQVILPNEVDDLDADLLVPVPERKPQMLVEKILVDKSKEQDRQQLVALKLEDQAVAKPVEKKLDKPTPVERVDEQVELLQQQAEVDTQQPDVVVDRAPVEIASVEASPLSVVPSDSEELQKSTSLPDQVLESVAQDNVNNVTSLAKKNAPIDIDPAFAALAPVVEVESVEKLGDANSSAAASALQPVENSLPRNDVITVVEKRDFALADVEEVIQPATSINSNTDNSIGSLIDGPKNVLVETAVESAGKVAIDSNAVVSDSGASNALLSAVDGALLSIDFDADAIDISTFDKERLSELVQRMQDENQQRVRVVSYAQGIENQASSARRISLQRAIAVRSHLIESGLQSIRINVQAVGDKTKEGHSANSTYIYLIDDKAS